MNEILIVFGSALWLGILTSISPCPLATNIAAVSYLSKKIIHPRAVLIAGILYTLGRMLAYAILGFIIITSLLSVPSIAQFLQRYINKALGPILILVGLFLLNVLKINFAGFSMSSERQDSLAKTGARGAFILGFFFALSFCPISAALFFGSLIPLSLQNDFGMFLPFIYGIGTGLPVMLFAVSVSFGVQTVQKIFHKFSRIEYYSRKATGIIFILAGFYFSWFYLIAPWIMR